MKNKEKFDHSVGVLVKAYFNNTLAHTSCYACAVGNLIADGMGCKIIDVGGWTGLKWNNGENPYPYHSLEGNGGTSGWAALFCTNTGKQSVNEEYLDSDSVMKQVNATGYYWRDLAKIEFAFETAPKGNTDDDWMFNGLMAVVDVLSDIHEVSLEEKEQAKLLFVK